MAAKAMAPIKEQDCFAGMATFTSPPFDLGWEHDLGDGIVMTGFISFRSPIKENPRDDKVSV